MRVQISCAIESILLGLVVEVKDLETYIFVD